MYKNELFFTLFLIVSIACLACTKNVQPSSGTQPVQDTQPVQETQMTTDTQNSSESETDLSVQSLVNDFENLKQEYCKFEIKCEEDPDMTEEEAFKDCIQFLEDNAKPAMPSCPDNEIAAIAVTLKCNLDLYEELGDGICEPGVTHTLYNFKLKNCQYSYDMSAYHKCFCDHLNEIADKEDIEQYREDCQ